MIEKDFTELDNDFITVWSKFILSSKKQLRSIKHDIERLAELGQVNAVQSYYLFLKQDDKSNEIIDKIVEGYPDTDFNYLQAKTNKLMKEENYEEYCKQFYNAERDALITGRPNKIKDIILNSRSFKLLCDTKKKCFEQYKQTNDPLILESFFEISLGSTPWPIKEERKIFKMYNIIRKQLLAKFQENPNNNEIAFSLGKNMYYSKYFSLISRAKQGKEILHNLAIRPYSKNFLDYIDQVKKKKDNENMDKLLDKTGTFKESSSNGGKDKQK